MAWKLNIHIIDTSSDPDQRPSFQVIIQRMSGLLRRDGAATVEKNSEC